MSEDQMSPENSAPSKPLVTKNRIWSAAEIDRTRRELRQEYDNMLKSMAVHSKDGGFEKEAQMRLEEEVAELIKPTDAGLGIAGGQEPANFPMNPSPDPKPSGA